MESFQCLSVVEVAHLMATTNDFKANCNLVSARCHRRGQGISLQLTLSGCKSTLSAACSRSLRGRTAAVPACAPYQAHTQSMPMGPATTMRQAAVRSGVAGADRLPPAARPPHARHARLLSAADGPAGGRLQLVSCGLQSSMRATRWLIGCARGCRMPRVCTPHAKP